MGLAASQARFLGITARKNSCELRSMQIAQEKLSVTNQLTKISEDYQNSLDATRLVWDSEYITDGSIYDVSYALLMMPSMLNNYSPQLLTNHRNQIILNTEFANAIRDLQVGTDIDGNTLTFAQLQTGGAQRNENNFRKFLEGLNANGILARADYDKMINALTANPKYYDRENGVGGEIKEKFTSNAMNLPTLKHYIKTITDPNSKYVNELRELRGTSYDQNGNKIYIKDKNGNDIEKPDTEYDKVVKLASLLNFEGFNYTVVKTGDDGKPKNVPTTGTFGESIALDGTPEGKSISISDSTFNFGDLLGKEVYISSKNEAVMADAIVKFINQIYQIMLQFFEIDPKSVDKEYLDYAMKQICDLNGVEWVTANTNNNPAVSEARAKEKGGKAYIDGALSTGDPASKHTGIIKNGAEYQTSLSNIVKGVLTYFEKAVEGFDSGYSVESNGNKLTENSFYITQDPEYCYFIQNPEALKDDDRTQLLLDYYSQMFNQLCINGWSQNSLVEESEHLKNMLKNGTLFTSSLANDGNFYQAPYTSNNYIAEVTDESAITRAEAEYKTKQLKLSAKEEELNIDMQMVDAELSALTTELDTVKSMISKSVEKGFSTLGGD